MDYHRQEYGQPLPPLVDDRMLYCPRPMMAGMASPYEGFIRQYAGAASMPHHMSHHPSHMAMPPAPMNLSYQAMTHGQQVAPPVNYMPPPPHYGAPRQYLGNMMSSPPMLVPHSNSSFFNPGDSQLGMMAPSMGPPPAPPMVSHIDVGVGENNNTAKDAMLSMPPKLIPAAVASHKRDVNLSLRPPPLKSHPQSNVTDSSAPFQSSPLSAPIAVHSESVSVPIAVRSGSVDQVAPQVSQVPFTTSGPFTTSPMQSSWERSPDIPTSSESTETLDLTIRGLLAAKPIVACAKDAAAIKTELVETSTADDYADDASPVTVDGASYNAAEKRYTCLSCTYSSSRLVKIRQHMKAHQGQLICEDCGKAFIQTCDLERHMNAHLHGRTRNAGSKFNMADILLPRRASSDNCDDPPGMVHRHGAAEYATVAQYPHVSDGQSVDISDWHAASPITPYSQHAPPSYSSLPSMQHSHCNPVSSDDSGLAIVSSYSVSHNYHYAPTDSVTRTVAPSEIGRRCGDERDVDAVGSLSRNEAALMREGYRRHLNVLSGSPTAGAVPEATPVSQAAVVAMETAAGSQSAAIRTSPLTAAPPGERTPLDEIHSMTRLTGETSPQRGIEYANRFLYSGALVQTARDVKERFGLSTAAGLENAMEEDASDGNSNTINDEVAPNRRLDSGGDTNTQKTLKPTSGSQQLIDHLLQSDDDESPTTPPQGNDDADDALMSPQEALSSLPVGGVMFAKPPPMFFPDVGSGGIAPSPLGFPRRGSLEFPGATGGAPSSLDFPGRGVPSNSLEFPGRGIAPSSLDFPRRGSLEFPGTGVAPNSLDFPNGVAPTSLDFPNGVAPSSLEYPPTDMMMSPPDMMMSPTDMMLSPRPVESGVSLCCTLCNYTGRSQRSLQKHYKAHSQQYKICRYCRKAFERPSDLLRHEERHEMAIARNHTPMIMRGGNFGHPGNHHHHKKSKRARVLHCRRCGFATTEHHILALHNKKHQQQQHQPMVQWFCCDVCGQKFISRTSLELHCVLAHPVAAVRIDSYSKNVLTDTKVLSCSVSVDNVVQLNDVSAGWFESLREQEVPTVSSATDLRHIVCQSNVPEPAIPNRSDFGGADRPMDLSVYRMSLENDAVAPQNGPYGEKSPQHGLYGQPAVEMSRDVFNFDASTENAASDAGNSILPVPRSVASSPALDALRDTFAFPGSPDSDAAPLSMSSSVDSVGSPSVVTKRESSRYVRVGQYTCDQCSYSTNILRKMDQHKHAHDGRYICKLCYKAFIKTSDLTRHWFTHGITLEGQLKCDTCDYHTNNRDLLELHMKVHYHQRASYRVRKSSKHRACTICHEWVYKKAMQKHLLQVHNWPPSGGDEIPKPKMDLPKIDSPRKRLVNRSPKKNLVNHSPQTPPDGRSAKKKSPSSIIAPKYPGGSVWPKASSVVAPKSPGGCASPKGSPAGNTYMNKLTGYSCPECPEKFTSSRAIIQHLLVAHPIPSDTPSPTKPAAKKQIAAASNAKCELCNRVFADTIRLARHKAWHTRVSHPTRKQCPICEKLFKTVMSMNQHMRGHALHGQKPYECDRCGVMFGLHQSLLKHQQRKCGSSREQASDAAHSESEQDTIAGVEMNDSALTNGNEMACDDTDGTEVSCDDTDVTKVACDSALTNDTEMACDDTNGTEVVCDDTNGTEVVCDDTNGTEVACDDTNGTEVVCDDTNGTDVACDGTNGTEVACDDTNGTEVACDGTEVACDDINGTEVACDDTSGTEVACDDTNGTDMACDDTNGTEVARDDTNGTVVPCDDTNGTEAECEDTIGTEVACDCTSGTVVPCDDTNGTEMACDDTNGTKMACDDTNGTEVACDSTYGTEVACDDNNGTKMACDDTNGTEVACDNTNGTEVACDNTNGTEAGSMMPSTVSAIESQDCN